MTATEIAQGYGCPPHIAEAMVTRPDLPMFLAVLRIGPARVRWTDVSPRKANRGARDFGTHWLLDGKPATVQDMHNASRAPGADHRGEVT